MNKKRIIGIIFVIGAILAVFSIYTSADSATTPGSIDDPMVSKSYVDQKVAAEVAAQIAKLPSGNPSAGGTSALTVVKLDKGQTLMASSGSEFIVRTGNVTAVSNDNNGIPDITAGKDIAAKTAISLNHLLIFPSDKRGIQADPKKTTEIYVMVRGGYTVLNADGSVAVPAVITPAATATSPPSTVPTATATPAPIAIPAPTASPAPVVAP